MHSTSIFPSVNLEILALALVVAASAVSCWSQGSSSPQVLHSATWTAMGPGAISTEYDGLVSGRVTALALDPLDATGNLLLIGTTGGGVWQVNDAATNITTACSPTSTLPCAPPVFTQLTDDLNVDLFNGSSMGTTPVALTSQPDASISIGALTVQPGYAQDCTGSNASGVILAGTGDTNDALDSYYGAGILRSADCGKDWGLIPFTVGEIYGFVGESFAGFAWGPGTGTSQTVVAAVSEAYEGTLVNALEPKLSYMGLYYSTDAGATWNLSTITDGNGNDVQGPGDGFGATSNAATSVVWNKQRNLFIAAVRYHGYYQSADGITFTRMAQQPGTKLTTGNCPTNPYSENCPIYRGTLAVNPQTGDTFAWTVDFSLNDQGIWRDVCCNASTINFATQLNSSALDTAPNASPANTTIANGQYTLALSALPSGVGQGQDTILVAGANDLWRCSLATGCVWRNTTNVFTCPGVSQVGPYQHAVSWSALNPQEIFVGNDNGLWRSMDALGYADTTDPVCSANDAKHFQNLNGYTQNADGTPGSLAEVVSLSQIGYYPYTLMVGLGVNGTAGVKSGATMPTTAWPQVLDGFGGPLAVDPSGNWYVNNESGVSIQQLCTPSEPCTSATSFNGYNWATVVNDADVGGDGYSMNTPAPFLVDPLDPSQLLVGTCRVWRGPVSGVGWGATNAISLVLDKSAACAGSLIRSMAAMGLPVSTTHTQGGEVVYAGMYGQNSIGGNAPGHVFSATYDTASHGWSAWTDLTYNPVTNYTNTPGCGAQQMNCYGFDISSIFIDSAEHDPTGQTVYVTVEGRQSTGLNVVAAYRSTDGGAHWSSIVSNLPAAPANSVVVDPESANTVYVATDIGVYATQQVNTCDSAPACWSPYGTGLPMAPVTQLSVSSETAPLPHLLVAGTYGRGVWQAQSWGQLANFATVSVSPTSNTFPLQLVGIPNATNDQATFVVTNTGSLALTVSSISIGPDTVDFQETDTCVNATVAAGNTCSITVTFLPQIPLSPATVVTFNDTMIISADVSGGQLPPVPLNATSTAPPVSLSAAAINFNVGSSNNGTIVGSKSAQFPVSVNNNGTTAVTLTPFTTPGAPFVIVSNTCGSSLAAQSSCNLMLQFVPVASGPSTGITTFSYQLPGSQPVTETVNLSGTGLAPATDSLSPTTLPIFPNTIDGLKSTPEVITLTNSGDVPLTGILITTTGAFTETDSCTTQLAAHSSCAISVQFAPNAVGLQTGTLSISDILEAQPITVALSGTGLQSPAFSVNPPSPPGLTFSMANVGVASAPQTLTITNTGGAPLANVGFQITGPSASSFSCGTTICSATTCGATLANGSSCTVQVTFNPGAAGSNQASLIITSSTQNVGNYVVLLNGSGTAVAGLNVSTPSLNFGSVLDGQSSTTQFVTITNSGSATANGLMLTVTSTLASIPFSLTQNSCGSSLAAGASCNVGVIFTPVGIGAEAGTLTVSSGSQLAYVSLSGTGAETVGLQVSPASIPAFPITGVGVASTPVTVTITNPGSSQSLSGLTLTPTSGFQLVNNTCAATLAAQSSCTVGVEFLPTGSGTQTGSLTISGTGVQSVTVPLAGTGFDFAVTVAGTSSQTISSGQTAQYILTIQPSSGLTGTFTYTANCGTGLPSNSSCTFPGTTASTFQISGSNTGNLTVSIATGAAATARLTGLGAWNALPVACALILLPLGLKSRRKSLLMVALAGILLTGVCSCAGSGGGTGSGPGGGGSGGTSTPPGTYLLSITVTCNGVTHSVTPTPLSLTVD